MKRHCYLFILTRNRDLLIMSNLPKIKNTELGDTVFHCPAIILANYIINLANTKHLPCSSMKLQAIMFLLEGAMQSKFTMQLCYYKHYYVYSVTCYLPEIYTAFKNENNMLMPKQNVHADENGQLIAKPYLNLDSKMLDLSLSNNQIKIDKELNLLILRLLKNENVLDQIIKPDIQTLPKANTSLISQMPEYNPGHIAYVFIKNKSKIYC